MRLTLCSSCERHVQPDERRCPFCGTKLGTTTAPFALVATFVGITAVSCGDTKDDGSSATTAATMSGGTSQSGTGEDPTTGAGGTGTDDLPDGGGQDYDSAPPDWDTSFTTADDTTSTGDDTGGTDDTGGSGTGGTDDTGGSGTGGTTGG